MSLHDRRSASFTVNTNTIRPRALSGRHNEPDKSARNSPATLHNMDHARSNTGGPKFIQKEFSNESEQHIERATITTRERVHVKSRNPVKESANAENRRTVQRPKSKSVSRTDPSSPLVTEKGKEVTSGISASTGHLSLVKLTLVS